MTDSRSGRLRRSRRVRNGASTLLPADEAAEGAAVLREIGGSEGVLLWAALRDIALWASRPRAGREGIFEEGGADVRIAQVREHASGEALRAALLELAAMTADPAGTAPVRVARPCRHLAAWAADAGASETRLAFTEAAARALPRDGRLALAAGRLARDLARFARAEPWLRRAAALSRGSDWPTYVWAYVGLAWMYWRMGNHPAARAAATRALRTARRRHLHGLEAAALHDLFVFTSTGEGARLRQAYEHARAAAEAYDPAGPGLSRLGHDIACFWVDLGHYRRAVDVLHPLLARTTDPADRLLVAANLARAAAGAGNEAVHAEARRTAAELLDRAGEGARRAEALLMLARADALLGRWTSAADGYAAALRLAEERKEAEVRLVAEAELAGVLRRERAAPAEPAPESPATHEEGERLATRLVAALAAPPA